MMTFNYARITMPFADTGHIDRITWSEHVLRRDHLAELDFTFTTAHELTRRSPRSDLGFSKMSLFGMRRPRMLLAAPGDLNRIIAIDTASFNLAHRARTQLNNRNRTHAAGGINRLGHPYFLADQSTQHFFSPIQDVLPLRRDNAAYTESMAVGG